MRRHHRASGSAALANKVAAPLSDAVSMIRAFNSENNPSRPVRPSPLAASPIQDMPADLVERIRSFPLFQSTPDAFLAEIGLHLKPQIHSPNDYILTEGDDAKAMYWLVRGAVAVTSRDGESTYAELKPGAFFGEIGILMERPRTATIVARTRCFLVSLRKEDLKKILPAFPEVEQAIREEAQERLNILEKKKEESRPAVVLPPLLPARRGSKRMHEHFAEGRNERDQSDLSLSKKRKSPSPGLSEVTTSSALGNGLVNVRMLLKELPLFSDLPAEILHFLGLNAQPTSFPPFTDIIKQDSQGREVFFIVRGEVEVLDEKPANQVPILVNGARPGSAKTPHVKARLRQGQYFGEVVSLSLAPRRTATVRSVSAVECLMITGEVLAEFWERCPPSVRMQIETTAKERLRSASDNDVVMSDVQDATTPAIDELAIGERPAIQPKKQAPRVTFNHADVESPHKPIRLEDKPVLKPSDPDPYLNVGLDNIRSRSRRGSLAPIPPDETPSEHQRKSSQESRSTTPSPSIPKHATTPPEYFAATKRSRTHRLAKQGNQGILEDKLLVKIFGHLPLHELVRLRAVSLHWSELLTKSPNLFHILDLKPYNRRVNDTILTNIICPFVGARPRVIDISNCFHITDEGFTSLANICGTNVTSWKMKSVWDVTAPAILEMANKAKGLQEADLSNCRKVSDTLLARIVGWVVPATSYAHQQISGRPTLNTRTSPTSQTTMQSSAGTVFGCPYLKRLTLSYCKHITDRSMHHIASHAASRLEEVDLTRCTTITDQGFNYWGSAQFSRLRKLCLADCTYLTDNAIVYLTNSAKGLQELDLSFCCALSDTATEVLSLGCPHLTHLNLSFCGSAVSDPSLRSIGLHLLSLRELSVRGCVRVTGTGVDAVVGGCHKLEAFDVSQCKNLTPWLQAGGVHRYGSKVRFQTVARKGRLVR